MAVRLRRARIVDSMANLELERKDNAQIVEMELPAHSCRRLDLKTGESLIMRPRALRVFAERQHGHGPDDGPVSVES